FSAQYPDLLSTGDQACCGRPSAGKIKARRLSGDRSFGNTLRYVFRIKATGAFDLSEDGLSKQPVDDRLFSGESIAVTSCSCAKDCAPLARSYSKDHPLRSVHRAGPRLPRPGGPGFFHLLRESRKRNQPVGLWGGRC